MPNKPNQLFARKPLAMLYQEMKDDTNGEYGGLGLVIGTRDGTLTVISPVLSATWYPAIPSPPSSRMIGTSFQAGSLVRRTTATKPNTVDAVRKRNSASCPGEYPSSPTRIAANADDQKRSSTPSTSENWAALRSSIGFPRAS